MTSLTRRTLGALALTLTCSCGAGGSAPEPLPQVAAPTFSPAGPLNFGEAFSVRLASTTPGAAIHYTLDGTAPTDASPVYDAELSITETTTLKALAVHAGMVASAPVSSTFTHRPVTLAIDGGSWGPYGSTSIADQYLVANRFTPAAGDYPLLLRTVQVAFFASDAGTPVRLAVYADADADWRNGATLLATIDSVVLNNGAALGTAAWSIYQLPAPLLVSGPGDVLVGFVVLPPVKIFSHPLNQGGQSGGALAYWPGVVPNPPLLPSSDVFTPDAYVPMIRISN